MHQALRISAIALASHDVHDRIVLALYMPPFTFSRSPVTVFKDIKVAELGYASDDAKSLRVMHFKLDALPWILIFHGPHHAANVSSLARVDSVFLSTVEPRY
jgi:hypothetical protein